MKLTDSDLDLFIKILEKRGATRIECNKSEKIITFDFTIPSLFSFQIELPNIKEWLSLPSVYVIAEGNQALPHVGNNGLICITDRQGELFDSQNIEGLFNYTIEKAVNIASNSKDNISELYDEIEGYIETTLDTSIKIPLYFIPNVDETFYATTSNKKGKIIIHDIRDKRSDAKLPNNKTLQKIIVIQLTSIEDFIIPKIGEKFDKNWWKRQKEKFTEKQKEQLNERKQNIILLEIPFKNKRTYLVISYANNRLSVIKNNFNVQLIQRCWKDYLFARTGVQKTSTSKKTVVIAGCGSVGSKVAELLSETQIDKLILIDYDIMSSDNVMRHYLGLSDIKYFKVDSIKVRLNRDMPFVTIEVIKKDILSWIKERTESELKDIDHLILTTGHIPTELAISEYLYFKNCRIHIISGWVEAYGLGGQVYSFLNNSDGCLRCLYSDKDSSITKSQAQLFDPNGKVLSKNITGCTGAFTPYSGMHAMKTALLISELIVSPKYGLFTWVNLNKKPSDFDLNTTDFFDDVYNCGGQRFTPISKYKVVGCKCCSS